MPLKTCYSFICNDGVQFQMEIRKISRRRPRFLDYAELGHFTLLFYGGRQRIVQRFITHIHSYCFKPSVWWRSRCRRRRGLLKESLSTDVLSHGRKPEFEISPLRPALHPFRWKYQVVNAKMRALKLCVRAWKRARVKNINFRLTSVAQKRLCLSSLKLPNDDAENDAQSKLNLYFICEIRYSLDLLGTYVNGSYVLRLRRKCTADSKETF